MAQYRDRQLSEKSDSQTFWNEFFDIFGRERKSVAMYESRAKRSGMPGWIDLFWPGRLIVEQKSPGKDLEGAMEQGLDYSLSLDETDRPRYILACNFHDFFLVDFELKKTHKFTLKELPTKLGLFKFMNDAEPEACEDEEPVSVTATRLMSKIYLWLKDAGYDNGTKDGEDEARMNTEYLLTRLAYIFFADDTGIFGRRLFHKYVENRTVIDGSDLGTKLKELFEILNTPVNDRMSTLDGDLAKFPYIDGALFEHEIPTPAMDSEVRSLLLEASAFDWSEVSPTIFGSLFQGVMSAEERRITGSHYTTEENIMKVIRPLFLDGLRTEFEKIKMRKDAGRKSALEKFRDRLAGLRFLDPACGSGNFLVTAYKELRKLELEAIMEVHDPKARRFDPAGMPRINVDQFYGIELDGFPAKITETAMWMADHLANREISKVYGDSYVRIPLEKKANIWNVDALEANWNDVIPASECSYILGNPPFGGSKKMSAKQREQVRKIANLGGSGGTLDHVTAWFIKAVKYAPDTPLGLVATNSITQGEQVAQLWPVLLKDGRDISFAHRSFKWESDVSGNAKVTVVVIGLAKNAGVKRLFDEGVEENPKHISPYLIGFTYPAPLVSESPHPLNGLPGMVMGSKPIDGGHYIFNKDQRAEFLALEPKASKFLRPYVGAKEFINGSKRWILALHDTEPSELEAMPEVMKRMKTVSRTREKSTDLQTRKLAETPRLYHLNVLPSRQFLLIPGVSSERRKYVPMGYVEPPVIPSNATLIVKDTIPGLFGLLTSKMHMVWLKKIGGRLESRLRYSEELVYNTFPLPGGGIEVLNSLEPPAQVVLEARANHPGEKPGKLYNPTNMPSDLQKAHEKLDRAVDRLYRKKPFKDDHERLKFLLEKYGTMVQKNQKLDRDPKRERRKR